jgi:hypothetical protein
MIFEAHGNFILRTQGRILRVDAWGPWNLECTLAYSQRMIECIRLLVSPYAILAVSHEQPILSPEAEKVLQDNVRQRVNLGCGAQATVLTERSGQHIAHSQYERIYTSEGIPYGLFTTLRTAQEWLVECGFPDAELRWQDDVVELALSRQQRHSPPAQEAARGDPDLLVGGENTSLLSRRSLGRGA